MLWSQRGHRGAEYVQSALGVTFWCRIVRVISNEVPGVMGWHKKLTEHGCRRDRGVTQDAMGSFGS